MTTTQGFLLKIKHKNQEESLWFTMGFFNTQNLKGCDKYAK